MATEIKMPQLSDTMDQGKILSWRKKEGESVKRGDILAEVETDKANLEIESFQPGTLVKIIVPAGSVAKVGESIAVIGVPGEEVQLTNGSKPVATTVASPIASSMTPKIEPSRTPTLSSSERIKASPLARKVAQQSNVDLASIRGSGPDGRIIRKDVEAALERGEQPAPQTPRVIPLDKPEPSARAPSVSSQPMGGTSQPLSKMRETIARRMQESVTQAPHFYVTAVIDMDQVVTLRELLKNREEFKGLSINHFIIKGCAYALTHEPSVNCAYRGSALFEPDQINIGIITAVEGGLIIPVIREVNKLALKDVVFEARAAVERAKVGRPSSTDLSGGTFSISNLGMFDVENFTAIINPGQGAVLAVSSLREVPVVRNGQVVIGKQMKVTLSVDHRVIDGVMAANFLKYLSEGLENPALLMM